MEYEIESEDRLFDPSTNPSLVRRAPKPAWKPARTSGRSDSPLARRIQKAVLIPEEEQPA